MSMARSSIIIGYVMDTLETAPRKVTTFQSHNHPWRDISECLSKCNDREKRAWGTKWKAQESMKLQGLQTLDTLI